MGCDAVLSVTGYYNKPTQEGQYRHFMAIAEAVDIPILLYNIPGRAVVGISVETMARLAKHHEHHRGEGRHRQPDAAQPRAPGLWARTGC